MSSMSIFFPSSGVYKVRNCLNLNDTINYFKLDCSKHLFLIFAFPLFDFPLCCVHDHTSDFTYQTNFTLVRISHPLIFCFQSTTCCFAAVNV